MDPESLADGQSILALRGEDPDRDRPGRQDDGDIGILPILDGHDAKPERLIGTGCGSPQAPGIDIGDGAGIARFLGILDTRMATSTEQGAQRNEKDQGWSLGMHR